MKVIITLLVIWMLLLTALSQFRAYDIKRIGETLATITDEIVIKDETRTVDTGMDSLLVDMKITHYCKNSCCCGEYADGITASGVPAVGLIVAADTDYYPFGTKMTIDGVTYTVQDRGSAIKGPNRIDILCEDKDGVSGHDRAIKLGVINRKVKIER